MMKRVSILLIALCAGFPSHAQDVSFSKPGFDAYTEMVNPAKTDASEWAKVKKELNVGFGSDNIRYPKEKVPSGTIAKSWTATAWKGEKVHTQILVWTKNTIPDVTLTVHDLSGTGGNKIPEGSITTGFVRYVMSDEFGRGCGERKTTDYDSLLVEDPIDIVNKLTVQANTVQPVWLSIKVPADIPAGMYSGTVTVNAGIKTDLKITIRSAGSCIASSIRMEI